MKRPGYKCEEKRYRKLKRAGGKLEEMDSRLGEPF
jgi:hypothetical protein